MAQANDAHTISRRTVLTGAAAGAAAVGIPNIAFANSDHPEIETLSIMGLLVLFDAYGLSQAALLGIENQPRADGPVADIIFEERERCFRMRHRIFTEMKRRTPGEYEKDAWAKCIVEYRCIELGDQPDSYFDLAAAIALSAYPSDET